MFWLLVTGFAAVVVKLLLVLLLLFFHCCRCSCCCCCWYSCCPLRVRQTFQSFFFKLEHSYTGKIAIPTVVLSCSSSSCLHSPSFRSPEHTMAMVRRFFIAARFEHKTHTHNPCADWSGTLPCRWRCACCPACPWRPLSFRATPAEGSTCCRSRPPTTAATGTGRRETSTSGFTRYVWPCGLV